MQRRVEQADGDGQAVHRLEDALEVLALVRAGAWPGPCGDPRRCRPGSSSRIAQIRSPSKNMCSVRHRPMPSAPNSRARLASSGVSALVRTLRQRTSSAQAMSFLKSPAMAGGSVATWPSMTSPVLPSRVIQSPSLMVCAALGLEVLLLVVDEDVVAAGHAGLAHAAGDDGRVAGHAAAGGEDALGDVHAADVLGAGLDADEDDLLALLGPGLGVLGGEDDLADGGAGAGRQTLADDLGGLLGLGLEVRVEELVELVGSTRVTAVLWSIRPSLTMSTAISDGGLGGALAVAGLQHVELAAARW